MKLIREQQTVPLIPACLLTGWDPLPRGIFSFSRAQWERKGPTDKRGGWSPSDTLTSDTGLGQDPGHSACFFYKASIVHFIRLWTKRDTRVCDSEHWKRHILQSVRLLSLLQFLPGVRPQTLSSLQLTGDTRPLYALSIHTPAPLLPDPAGTPHTYWGFLKPLPEGLFPLLNWILGLWNH